MLSSWPGNWPLSKKCPSKQTNTNFFIHSLHRSLAFVCLIHEPQQRMYNHLWDLPYYSIMQTSGLKNKACFSEYRSLNIYSERWLWLDLNVICTWCSNGIEACSCPDKLPVAPGQATDTLEIADSKWIHPDRAALSPCRRLRVQSASEAPSRPQLLLETNLALSPEKSEGPEGPGTHGPLSVAPLKSRHQAGYRAHSRPPGTPHVSHEMSASPCFAGSPWNADVPVENVQVIRKPTLHQTTTKFCLTS